MVAYSQSEPAVKTERPRPGTLNFPLRSNPTLDRLALKALQESLPGSQAPQPLLRARGFHACL